MNRLAGQVALITGAARGIGAATARKFAAEGAAVVLSDLDQAPTDALAAELRSEGHRTIAVTGDLADGVFADALPARAIEEFGDLHIVVNTAGYIWPQAIHKMTDEQFDAVMDIHVRAPFRILRAAGRHFRAVAGLEATSGRARHRRVVNISSLSGTSGGALSVNYSSAKAAVIGMTRALAQEWGRYRVNVNCVAFGMIDTRLTDPTVAKDPVLDVGGHRVNIGTAGADRQQIERTIPLGRTGTVEEAAGAIWLFCTPESDFITGEVLVCGGGSR